MANHNGIYDERIHPKVAAALARGGQVDREIAAAIGISLTALKKWRKAHPEFDAALREGKALADAQVEHSLYEKATKGWECTEERIVALKKGKDGEESVARIERTKKVVPPDTTAMIFWLKNRRPDLWRDAQRHEFEGKVKHEFGDDERALLADIGRALLERRGGGEAEG
jgi:transposase-like protein